MTAASNKWYTAEQLAKILAHVRAEEKRLKSRRAKTDRLVIEILTACALRRQELCDLSMRDLPQWHGKPEIHVRCGKGGKARVVPCPDALNRLLVGYVEGVRAHDDDELTEDSPLLVGRMHKSVRGRRMTGRTILQMVHRIGKACGFTGSMRLSVHSFRRSAATLHLDVGGSLTATQHLLGHSNISTTNSYVNCSREQSQKIAEQASAALEQAVNDLEKGE